MSCDMSFFFATHRRVSGEAYRRADVISLSIEDRIYDYAVKLAVATFKQSTGVENFREYFWRDR